MCPQIGINYLRFQLIIIWITLISTSTGAVSSTVCPGEPNFVTSSASYTHVQISSRYFRNGQSCTWTIERKDCSGRGVEVYLSGLYGLRHGDSVTTYDGPSATTRKQLGTYEMSSHSWRGSGGSTFGPTKSSGRFITVVIQFRHEHRAREFEIRYRNTPTGILPSNTQNRKTENLVSDTCGEETLMAYPKLNFITSPGYPREYGNSLDCKWTVMSDDVCNDDVIQVNIHTLSLEENYDHLVIYDGGTEFDPVLRKLSGNGKPEVIVASGNSIVIEFKTDDTAPGRGFHLSYFRTQATPSLSDPVTIKLTETTAEMSVDFLSGIPHNAVFWSKDGVIVQQDDKHTLTVNPAEVSVESEPGINVDGFRASLLIEEPEPHDFGMYTMAVRNKFGVSERMVLLKKGHSAPVIHNYTVISENATIMVMFSSHPDFKVEWYKGQHLLTSGSDVNITTERYQNGDNGDENEAVYKSVLVRTPPREPDFGDCKCLIINDVGIAEIYMYMDFPKTELPKLLVTPSAVEMNDEFITVSVNFDSNIVYPRATWYRGNVLLETSEKFEMKLEWKGINSSDWLKYGYPVPRLSREQRGLFQSPSLGGARQSTQPNANYTAVLTITKFTHEDFGPYRVVLENKAGITHHVIDVTTPEVFPYATCDQADNIQLVCNVTSCAVTQSWTHSVDGDVIRHLPGHQDGAINTLTIPMCMYSDAGIYTCVATDEETGSDVAINHDKTALTVRAVPVILESAVGIQTEHILIEVPFYSNPSPRRVTWYRNGDRIHSSGNNTIETESRHVNVPMYGKSISLAGQVTSIRMLSSTADNFGIYKITISNEMGTSEHSIHVQNPEYANPVVSSDTEVTFDRDSAVLNLTLSSYYPQSSVKWYFTGREVRDNHPANKYVIQANSSGQVADSNQVVRRKATLSSILTVTCLTQEDYGMYDAVVSNIAGKTVVPVRLTEQGQGIPKMVAGIVTKFANSTAELSATFHSSSGYRLVKWLKGDNEITNDSVKYNIVNEDVDIKISSNGETMEETGTITRLSVTSLEDPDYGLYTVQIYNDIGMIDSSVALDEECG